MDASPNKASIPYKQRLTTVAKTAIVMLACAAVLTPAYAQTKQTKSKPTPAVETVAVPKAVADAEEAIGKKDYDRAEPLLLEATQKDPKDYRAWYDLGFVFQATNRVSAA